MHRPSAEVVVIGAGVVGCATAYYLSKEGAQVTIVEQDTFGSHASARIHRWTGMGGVRTAEVGEGVTGAR